MEYLQVILQILTIVLGPWCCMQFSRRAGVEDWLSPVVLSYLLGIVLANTGILSIRADVSTHFSEATVLLAIPMLLYGTDLVAWLGQARLTIVSFVLCVVSGILISGLAVMLLGDTVENSWLVSGMLVGVYTGGTPNMQAIGLALGAPQETYVLMNAADIFCGGIYLLFLTSVAHKTFGFFLTSYQEKKNPTQTQQVADGSFSWGDLLKGLGLSILIIALSVGVTWLLFGDLKRTALILLLLTSFSILASLNPRIRVWRGTYEGGDYLLLMFCVAVGMLSDFSTLWADGGSVILYTAFVLSGTVLLHLLLCRIFRVDRDTALITSTAALYGPAFIGQVASAIRNRQLIFPGIATALVGMAIGNYLGVGVGELLRYLLMG